MPRLSDKDDIRSRLCHDRVWSLYALGDLVPNVFVKTQWFAPDLTLVLHDYGTCILFAMGTGSVREALDHVTWPARLQVQSDALDEIAPYATVDTTRLTWRMRWSGAETGSMRPVASGLEATRLGPSDVPALQQLYADGQATGESPDFFFPSMVASGVFFGVHEGDALVAAAGTHLLSREEGTAAIGNVYTRRDRRRQGLGCVVTSAVVDALAGIETIGLNVRADNDAALRVYESLGFVRHCRFYEALASGWRDPNAHPVAPSQG